MNKHKISGKSSEKLLFGSMAAAALGLINAKPKTVKADSVNKSRATLNKANKRAAKTKLNYQTAIKVKTADTTEEDQKVKNDQGTDNEAESEINNQSSVTTQDNNTNTTQNSNVETRTYTSDSASNKFDSDETKRDDTTSLQGTWTQNKIPVTFNTDTGVMEIGDKTKDSTFNWDGNGSAGIANHIQGIPNFDPASVKEIHIIGKVTILNNADGLFEGLTNLTKITGLEKFDTKETYDMESMFNGCASLTSLDLSSFDTKKLSTDVSANYSMRNMFEGCTSLVELNILNFYPNNIDATKDMFKGVTKLRKLVVGADFCANGVTLANTGLGGEGSWVNMGEGEYAEPKGQHIYQTTADFIKEPYLNDTYIRFEKLGGKITVHYQDNDKNAIPDMDDDDQFGNIGDSLVNDDPITAFQPKDKVTINGKAYTLSGAKIKDTTVDLKDVKFSADQQEVTLIYAPEEAKPVTVYYKYKDEAGNLHDILNENGKPKTKTVSGYLGDKSAVTFDDLANYKKDSYQINEDPVTESTDNPAVTLGDQEQTVTLIYDRIPAGKVAVYYKYKDEAGNLHDILDENGKPKTKTVSGYLGDKPAVTFDDLANYKKDSYQINDDPVTESTDNPAVTLSEQEQKVTLIYDRIPAGKVAVYYKYKDEAGNLHDILDENGKPKTKTVSGYLGDKPAVTFDDLANYKKDSYQINEDPVTESTDNPAVTLGDQEQTVTLIYDRIPAGKVAVYYKYKDEAGNLHDILDENGKPKATTVSGYLGDKPAVTFDDLANYKKDSYQINKDPVTESTDNPTVPLSEQEQTVTLIYDRIPAGKVAVYYKYKDEAGKLHDILDENGKPKTTTVSGYLGDKSAVSFDDLANYKKDSYQINDDPATESTDNPTIPLSEQEQKVTLIYTEKKTNNGSESNGSESNGSGSNGSESNGSGSNGSESNGSGSNGSESNGSGSNGSESNGSGSNGSESNGSGSNNSGSNGSNASNTAGSIVNSPAAIAPAVTVHYQDEYGNTVAPDRVIQGRIGDGYTTGAETVSGYTLKTRPDNATGFFINSPQSVTYVYSKSDGQTNNSTTAPAGNQTQTDNEPTPIPTSKKTKKKKAPKKASKGLHANKQSKKGKKAPAKSIKGFTANKHQANRPAKLAAAARKSTSVNDPQKGKLSQESRTNALPQTGAEKHNSLAMLALGGLALATALGAAWLNRKKD